MFIQNTILNETLESLQSRLTESHVRLVIPRPLPSFLCDATRIGETFLNLITNAIKYNDKPEKIIEIGYQGENP